MKSKSLILSVVVALAGFLPQSQAALYDFPVLGGSTVTSTGNTRLNGDLGVYPGDSITGFGSVAGTVTGATHNNDPTAISAHSAASTAYDNLASLAPTLDLTGHVLGTGDFVLLPSGVYHFGDAAALTGTLTLSGTGDFVFQIGSTLTTASSSSISLINGAQAGNVFWQVGSSATLGADTSFDGSILADQSITLNNGASMSGRALALNGAVTLDGNEITGVPEPATFWLLTFCASVFGAWRWFAVWRRQQAGRS